jgi:hypothetical protein
MELEALALKGAREPIGCDVSDYSDEFVGGFLAGQVNALQALYRRLCCDCALGCSSCCS